MTKYDVKNYLEKIYEVPVGAVRTRIQFGPSAPHLKSHEELLFLCQKNGKEDTQGEEGEERRLTKRRGKGKPLKRGGWKAVSCGWTGRGEKKGPLGAPGDPEVRQRRYPCLRQEFHSIGSVKMGTSGGEQGV
ncbi:hypothetical protein D4764_13G0002820 [Takifugu flavidus]|uniref:39S ribosomal protein L23, mitochondrial n=1 Tax=Takifugu flavidus TaxID=433684 RepID=A0A5C6PBF5_9TELE|nr:hypothetical protein D4764_13G0002820 [Takifugu flavidus]